MEVNIPYMEHLRSFWVAEISLVTQLGELLPSRGGGLSSGAAGVFCRGHTGAVLLQRTCRGSQVTDGGWVGPKDRGIEWVFDMMKPYGGCLNWGYPQPSSISRWDVPL